MHRLLLDIHLDIGVRIADAHQENCLANGVCDIFTLDDRFWHARELGEFVNHPADVIDLTDNGIRALIEDRAIFGNNLAELAADITLQTIESESGIFDFMRDLAPRPPMPKCVRVTSP